MNIQAEITAIETLERQIRTLPEPRTPYLDVAAGGLQSARENLQWHLDSLARQAEAANSALPSPQSELPK